MPRRSSRGALQLPGIGKCLLRRDQPHLLYGLAAAAKELGQPRGSAKFMDFVLSNHCARHQSNSYTTPWIEESPAARQLLCTLPRSGILSARSVDPQPACARGPDTAPGLAGGSAVPDGCGFLVAVHPLAGAAEPEQA